MQNLRFLHINRRYDLEFNHFRVMQIWGDSGTGKSLLCSDFAKEQKLRSNISNSLVIDYFNSASLQLLKGETEYRYVFVDNADLILTPEYDKLIKEKILSATKTYWIILGRKYYECVISSTCIGTLCSKTDEKGITTFTIDYMGVG